MEHPNTPDNETQYIEIPPYDQVTLPSEPPVIVYHQGDEEQHATINPQGQIELRGPHDWWLKVARPHLDYAAIDAAIDGAKDRWDHADAPHNPDILALIRAAEQMRRTFRPAGAR